MIFFLPFLDNNLDLELAIVVNGVARSRSLVSLNISRNLSRIKAKDTVHVMEAIVQLIQVSSLISLHILQ
jgi:hypothetical protein